jgi:hypothetical protein
MFLVRGEILHEEVWTRWLGNLSQRVPASLYCDAAAFQCYESMTKSSPVHSVYDEQQFFSIVVHPQPGFPGYANGSIFDGRIVPRRIKVLRPACTIYHMHAGSCCSQVAC